MRSSSPVQRTRAQQASRGRQTQNSLRAGLSSGLANTGRESAHTRSHLRSQSTQNISLSSVSHFRSVSSNSFDLINTIHTKDMTGPIAGSSNAPGSSSTGSTNIPQNPILLTQNSPRQRMPKPGEKNAPSFDPEKPEELGRFFERIEDWFSDEGITSDEDKKKRIVKYLDADSEIQWKALPRFANGTFLEFKEQVMSSYPAAEEVMKGSVAALKRKIKRIGPVAADERDDLLSLIRIMTAEVMKLKRIAPPIHTNRELVELFLSSLTPEFASRVASKLSVHRLVGVAQGNNAIASRNPEDMYDIEDVMKMAQHTSLEQANPFGKFLLGAPSYQGASSAKLEEAVAKLTDSINLQTQHNRQVDQRLASLQNVISRPGANSNQNFGQGNQNSYSRSQGQIQGAGHIHNSAQGRCFYCDEVGHRIPDCGHVLQHLDLGWIKKIDGFMRLPDGSKLPRDASRSTKDLIEALHKAKPGIIKLPERTSLYQGKPNACAYMHAQSDCAEADDSLKCVLELVQKIGLDQAMNILTTQVQAIEEEEDWLQNFI